MSHRNSSSLGGLTSSFSSSLSLGASGALSPSSPAAEVRYCFLTEWFDATAQIIRKYNLYYYVIDSSIEMYDLKHRRTFLKRCAYPSISLTDLYVGASIAVFARQLKIVAYGDEFTANKLSSVQSRSIVVIPTSAFNQSGRIIDAICTSISVTSPTPSAPHRFVVSRLRMCRLTLQQAQQFYNERVESARARALSSGPSLAIEFVGSGVQSVVASFVAAQQSSSSSAPSSFGSESKNGLQKGDMAGVHVSQSAQEAERESAFFFENSTILSTAQFHRCTVCVIKPHILAQGLVGRVLDHILSSGYQPSAMQLFTLDRRAAEEFLEVYKGVLPEYNALVEHMVSGPVIAMELVDPHSSSSSSSARPSSRRQAREMGATQSFQQMSPEEREMQAMEELENTVNVFREICGPSDPEVARALRPQTLRAVFGQTKVQNAVHCTDLPEDGPLESEYFFSILQKSKA